MALKPCRECKKEVSTEAKICPHCGCDKPVPKKVSWVGWIAVGLVAFVVYSCTSRFEEASKLTPTSTAAISTAPATPAMPKWEYGSFTDKLDGTVSTTAAIRSVNTMSFDFPYNKPDNRGGLILRKNKKTGLNIMLRIDHGQLTCNVYECKMRVRFDDEPPLNWTGSPPSDGNSNTIFLSNEASFLQKLRKAKTVKVEPNFFRISGVVLEFRVTDLNWQ